MIRFPKPKAGCPCSKRRHQCSERPTRSFGIIKCNLCEGGGFANQMQAFDHAEVCPIIVSKYDKRLDGQYRPTVDELRNNSITHIITLISP